MPNESKHIFRSIYLSSTNNKIIKGRSSIKRFKMKITSKNKSVKKNIHKKINFTIKK